MSIDFGRNLYTPKKCLQNGNFIKLFINNLFFFKLNLFILELNMEDKIHLCFTKNKCKNIQKKIIARKFFNKWRQNFELKTKKRYIDV